MSRSTLATDGLIAVVAGSIASAAMSPVTTVILDAQSPESKDAENRASYGVADQVAVGKLSDLVGIQLTEKQVAAGKQLMHYGLGVGLAPAYMALRRRTGLSPWAAGLLSGVGLFAVVDEGLNPLLGITPPAQAYPLVTHVRGLVGHVVLGLTLAAAVEAGWRLSGRRP